MAHCVEKLPHTCGSSDGLQVFQEDRDGGFTGYCFACSTYVPDPYSDKPAGYKPEVKVKTEDEIQADLAEISNYRTVDLPDRRLSEQSLSYFKIRIGFSEADGITPALHYYPYYRGDALVGYKVRLIDGKKFWAVGTTKDVDLFGWQQAVRSGAKRLYITEGELDAVAVYQALRENNKDPKYADLHPAVVSLINGAGSARKALADNADKIRQHFQEVVLVFDQDEPGKKAVQEALLVFPDAKTVELPAKDPNECLIAGYKKGLANALLFKASMPKNTRIISGSALYEAGREQAQWGKSWPWEKLTELTRGIRTGETYYIGAGVKMGKSELVNAIAKHLIVEHNWPVFMAKPEETNKKSWQLLLGKVEGKFFHDPKIKFDYEAYDRAAKVIGDKVKFLDIYQNITWDHLKADIIYAAAQGCKAVFIDPITNLTNGIPAAEANTVLQTIAQGLSTLAKDLDIAVFIFCHLKAPDAGPPHEKGGKVESYQFSGSRAMMRSCNYMIGLEGNKDPDLPEEQRNIRTLVLLEDREFGNVGKVRLYWDSKTGLFNEVYDE